MKLPGGMGEPSGSCAIVSQMKLGSALLGWLTFPVHRASSFRVIRLVNDRDLPCAGFTSGAGTLAVLGASATFCVIYVTQ
jgi:hypothetical protein